MKPMLTVAILLLAGAVPAHAQTAAPAAPAPTDGTTAAAPGAAAPAPAQPASPAPGAAAPAEAGAGSGSTKLPNGMDLTPDSEENGRWYNADGIPVPKIEADGTVDFATFNGYRRYQSECHVCHGPDGEGSSYAPALKNSVLKIDYYTYQQVVASGKQNVGAGEANLVMPAFGTNKNVWCYVDDIYVYLLARGVGELPRDRPAKRGEKSDAYKAQEDSCMSG